MKRVSWEIILAGIFFVAIAFYLLSLNSDDYNEDGFAEATPSEPTPPNDPTSIQVIELQSLESLSALKELEVLKELEKVEHLDKLKGLAHLIPEETREEFLTEIDKAIREFSNDEFSIKIDSNDRLIVAQKEYQATEGDWGKTSSNVYTYSKEYDASAITSTSISMPGGSITIVGTNEKIAKLTIQASGKISSLDDLKSHVNTVTRVSDSELVFLVEPTGNANNHNIQFQTTLYVPSNMELSSETDGGHIESSNITGDQIYQTGGGHIKIRKATGDVIALSGGGHIISEDIKGDLTLKTEGGNLVVKKCTGDVSVKTSGGNIELKEVDGEIISSTNGGNISIYLNTSNHDITAETYAGNVLISIPKSGSATIDLKASNEVEIRGFSFEGARTKDKAKGKLNGGGSEIIAFTKYGKVSIVGNGN